MLGGCGAAIRGQAIDTASLDHGCPERQIRVTRDASVGASHAYWMDVCGRERLYRYVAETEYTGRFVDVTDTTQ
jgi:hypothetical protein